MNKTLLKNFATAARTRLMQDVRYRLGLMGITEKGIAAPLHQAMDMEEYEYARGQSYRLFGADVAARRQLADMVRGKGFEQLVEEVAYTWFNRLIAIRFMEVNDYLPTHTRVLSSVTPGQSTPDIVTYALEIDLGLSEAEKQQVLAWKLHSQTDELFRFLFLKQCRQLGGLLPGLFGDSLRQNNYAYSLLLTISCVSPDGIVAELLKIPETYFNVSAMDEEGQPTGQVEIIGWMYQYYNTQLKDETFALLKKNVKITKERIGAATQLFTPDWIVKYMVENSLGRLWLEGHPNPQLQKEWRYYLAEAEQEPEVAEKLAKLREESKALKLEDVKFLDPCMGSGHILVYAFDLLMGIYRSQGYTDRDAAQSIVANNLYGLDIDDRAAQLAYFAVMMKACEYDNRFLSRKIQPQVFAIQESNGLDVFDVLPGQMRLSESCLLLANKLIEDFRDAKLYGSLIQIEGMDVSQLDTLMDELKTAATGNLQISSWYEKASILLPQLVKQMMLLASKYDVVVTNPPYMGSGNMNNKLSDYAKYLYPNGKSDLFAMFMERCVKLCETKGYYSMITQQAWMFLSSYENLRAQLQHQTIMNMVHLGARAFDEIGGEVVQTTSFVISKSNVVGYKGSYIRLIDHVGEWEKNKYLILATKNPSCGYYYITNQSCFAKILGFPIAYWASEIVFELFGRNTLSNEIITREGMATADNDRFLRFWQEVELNNIGFHCSSVTQSLESEKKWFPYNKGGDARDWFGNNILVVNWYKDGESIRNNQDPVTGRIRSHNYNDAFSFLEGITWTVISSGNISVRYSDTGFLFDSKGAKGFCNDNNQLKWTLALLNSKVSMVFLDFISATLDFKVGDILKIPSCHSDKRDSIIVDLSDKNITLSRTDWDMFETSWDFKKHPML